MLSWIKKIFGEWESDTPTHSAAPEPTPHTQNHHERPRAWIQLDSAQNTMWRQSFLNLLEVQRQEANHRLQDPAQFGSQGMLMASAINICEKAILLHTQEGAIDAQNMIDSLELARKGFAFTYPDPDHIGTQTFEKCVADLGDLLQRMSIPVREPDCEDYSDLYQGYLTLPPLKSRCIEFLAHRDTPSLIESAKHGLDDAKTDETYAFYWGLIVLGFALDQDQEKIAGALTVQDPELLWLTKLCTGELELDPANMHDLDHTPNQNARILTFAGARLLLCSHNDEERSLGESYLDEVIAMGLDYPETYLAVELLGWKWYPN